MSMTLSSARTATRMVSRSFSWSMEPSVVEVVVDEDGAEVADGGLVVSRC
jgi:hypothetical protein